MPKGTILAIDDDNNLQLVIRTYLEGDGYTVLSAVSGQEALVALNDNRVDAVLLDLMLPDQDGFTLLTRVRTQYANIPVIVVSGKEDTMDKVVGLELGADDYITKPFEMRELSARIKAVMRRHVAEAAPVAAEANAGERVYFGNWYLDRAQYQVFDLKGGSMDLTSGEFKMLEILVMSPNRVLTREQLFDLTRDANFDGYDRAVDIQIGRIRKKFDDNIKNPHLIKTVRGIGYMFVGEIRYSP